MKIIQLIKGERNDLYLFLKYNKNVKQVHKIDIWDYAFGEEYNLITLVDVPGIKDYTVFREGLRETFKAKINEYKLLEEEQTGTIAD